MKAIILSAGLGCRLRPTTEELPKCLLPVHVNQPVLELQLRALAQCGIRRITIMVGHGAEKVERFLAARASTPVIVQTRYNPFFATTNTLVTCWLAAPVMTEDFVLLNGDTLFDAEILQRILAAPAAPLTMAIDRKTRYGEDAMKITLQGGRRLKAVSKTLPPSSANGESLGLMVFRGQGVAAFRAALDVVVRDPAALHKWYHDLINLMADSLIIETENIQGLWWKEIDTSNDLEEARAHLAARKQTEAARLSARS